MTISAPELYWPARDADERAMLEGHLEAYRRLAVRKVAGLDAEQLATRSAPSTVTLGGLLTHLAAVEDDWFNGDVAGNEYPEPWASVASRHLAGPLAGQGIDTLVTCGGIVEGAGSG